MRSRAALALAVLCVAAVGALPSQAAGRARHAPITGSYDLTLYPDPTVDVVQNVPGHAAACGTLPQSIDDHAFFVPAAGTLHVLLNSPDPTPGAAPVHADWDLYLLDDEGGVLDASHGPSAHEETTDKFSKKQHVVFRVCNVTGETTGHVSYTFTFK